jgi:hypothetical protein
MDVIVPVIPNYDLRPVAISFHALQEKAHLTFQSPLTQLAHNIENSTFVGTHFPGWQTG